MGHPERLFAPPEARGGESLHPEATADVLLEYQNEFATEGGKLHEAVRQVMQHTQMLPNSAQVCDAARSRGCKVVHVPWRLRKDMADNPNRGLGILKGCADGELFVDGTWNAEICHDMRPKRGDLVVTGKAGPDAFIGSNLEATLV